MVSLLTGPSLVLLIVVPLFLLAALRMSAQAARRLGWLGWLPTRRHNTAFGARGVGATATEELHALIYPSKRVQLEQRRIELILRDDEQDGAPKKTGIDLDSGIARLEKRRGDHS
ncbi:DUF6191 domain-containing protein [Streptomyces sp. NPDC002446]